MTAPSRPRAWASLNDQLLAMATNPTTAAGLSRSCSTDPTGWESSSTTVHGRHHSCDSPAIWQMGTVEANPPVAFDRGRCELFESDLNVYSLVNLNQLLFHDPATYVRLQERKGRPSPEMIIRTPEPR